MSATSGSRPTNHFVTTDLKIIPYLREESPMLGLEDGCAIIACYLFLLEPVFVVMRKSVDKRTRKRIMKEMMKLKKSLIQNIRVRRPKY